MITTPPPPSSAVHTLTELLLLMHTHMHPQAAGHSADAGS